MLHENKIRKNINPENFLQNTKQEFPCQSLESFSVEYYNMENKILNFQFEPVCTKQTSPNYSVGSNQDEIQYDQWSTQEWYNYEKCEDAKQLKILKVKAFHLKFNPLS